MGTAGYSYYRSGSNSGEDAKVPQTRNPIYALRMKRIARIAAAALIMLTWLACASYLALDQFLEYENRWAWLDWTTLLDLAGKALMLPYVIVITGMAALALIWTPLLRNRGDASRGSHWQRVGLTLTGAGISSALWIGFQRSERFIHLVAGTGTHLSVDAEKRELIWSGRISYFMPNIVFTYAGSQPGVEWTLVLKDVPGGSIDASNSLVGLASDFGIHAARVDGDCYSMCANVWISFDKIEIVEGSVLGWHGLYDAATGEPMRASIDNALLPFLLSRGMPEDLAKHWVNLPIGDFYEMSVQDLAALDIGVKVLPRPR